MKWTTAILVLVVLAGTLPSCSDDITGSQGPGFIKTFESEHDIATVGSILLDDQSCIVVCRSIDETVPGTAYRIDAAGNLMWKKRLESATRVLWQASDIPGDGFVTIGYGQGSAQAFEVSHYSDNGDLLSSKLVPLRVDPTYYSVSSFSPFQMQRLRNGNYVFSSNFDNYILVCVTNSVFDTLSQHYHRHPHQWGAFVRGITELPDSSIAVASSYGVIWPPYVTASYFGMLVLRTGPLGELRSLTLLGDSLHNETPNALQPIGANLLMITGRMGRLFDGSGTFVSYLNSSAAMVCAGEINLLVLASDGRIIRRQGVRDYPENGVIMSARPTADGGFILCGIVNQPDENQLFAPTRIYLMKLSASGLPQWTRMLPSAYASLGIDAVPTRDGGYLVTGYEKAFDRTYVPIVIKTDAAGNF